MSSFTRSMAPRILADATLVPRRSPSATASATAARFRSTRADDKEAAEDETAEDGDAIVVVVVVVVWLCSVIAGL